MSESVDSASPLDITVRGWISANDRYPRIGQKCIVCIEGIVQDEIYTLDGGDDCPQYWSRDDIDECPFVKESDFWMPLPEAPNALAQASGAGRVEETTGGCTASPGAMGSTSGDSQKGQEK